MFFAYMCVAVAMLIQLIKGYRSYSRYVDQFDYGMASVTCLILTGFGTGGKYGFLPAVAAVLLSYPVSKLLAAVGVQLVIIRYSGEME